MKPVVLIIRDGWGFRESHDHNSLFEVPTPNTDRLMQNYPTTLINASGKAAGLPDGYQGNSEVGHMTIGSGRIITQSLPRISKSIEDGSFFSNQAFLDAITNCKHNNTSLHLMGLLQREGVHAHLDHLFGLLDLCQKQDFKDVKVHLITDGRDAPVTKSLEYINELVNKLNELGFGQIVSVTGRYFAMDRDKRWDRTKMYYDAAVHAQAEGTFTNVLEQVKACHHNNETDESIKPRVLEGYEGIKQNDSIIFYNFRTDRPRQFTQAMVEDSFDGFERTKIPVHYVTMTKFYNPMNASIAFGERDVSKILGQVISEANLKQLRISETEKYAHVTFFFNAEKEVPFKGEERILIPSPREVATYDEKPEMSAYKITEQLIENLDNFDVIITNIVNGDMVGHTGITDACHKAVEVVDECVGKICDEVLKRNGAALVFADHGNIEDQTDAWRTSHTTNPVPFILVSNEHKGVKLKSGCGLQDVAPTALALLGLKKPDEMTGSSLIE